MNPELSRVSGVFDIAAAEVYLTSDAFPLRALPKIRFRAFQHPEVRGRSHRSCLFFDTECFRYLW